MENSVVIDYSGIIKYETMGELIHIFKQEVHKIGIPTGVYKRILLVMIESLENIMKHSEIPPETTDNKLFPGIRIEKHPGYYTIRCSNILNINNQGYLMERIEFLNHLDPQGIKEIYKKTITNGVFSKGGGAGLGLIEIIKISGNPIHYKFQSVDNDYARYEQLITINEK